MIFNVDSISGKQFFEKTFAMEHGPFYTQYCHPWARSSYLYNADSIASYVTNTPLQQIVALTYFITQQQRHLLALDVFDDPTINVIYRRAHSIFSKHGAVETDQRATWMQFCQAIALQFNKIAKVTKDDSPSSKKRAIKYAEDGVIFSNKMLRLCDNDDPGSSEVTPIELEADAKSHDLLFVEEFRELNPGRFSWQQCYDNGKEKDQSLFTRYKSHITLRQAFYDNTL